MHTGPMKDSDGTFGPWEPCAFPCRKCKSDSNHRFRVWASNDGGYEDWQHECLTCGHTWWIEGIDS